ncbi:type II toxin-antitoxin system YhaV family toxin [Maritimibacter sp. DP07]|uniref:Type II toxin-antitoxin system YhaV family toxin n=1 Tax=Maritimibacter harenae TaxID=2606218 RepID=A0A845M3Z8_9RHOB|nr:type II toxin-antitoxin system YhaV family toxin [Maritimibacter harenae]MZR13719.1 type II toxin-antitoxin system YhaV family toxin [Maritimibacter harenae]
MSDPHVPGALVVNGWTLLQDPAFAEAYEDLVSIVEGLREKHPETYQKKAPTKILAAIEKLTKDVIPSDPTASAFDLGNTIGPEHRAWKRAKFLQQFRLFFRYDTKSKIIIYGWVNDESTKRAYGSKTDAYKVFQKRLATGDPPSNWNDLIERAAPIDQS